MNRLIDLTGQRFGRLTVVSRAENDARGQARWYCNCECGAENIIVRGRHLISGHTQSCGCLHNEGFSAITSKHLKSNEKLYGIWADMKRRTKTETRKDFKYYGGRGIKVCNEWDNDFEAFYKWACDNGYADGLDIDRKDNDKDYTPQNCRWVTHKKNCSNKSDNRHIMVDGVTKTLSEWADCSNINQNTLLQRLKRGWSIEKALTTPTRKRK